jgi:hypothetical protein
MTVPATTAQSVSTLGSGPWVDTGSADLSAELVSPKGPDPKVDTSSTVS